MARAKKSVEFINPAANLKVYVKLEADAQSMFNHQRPGTGNVTFSAMVKTVSGMVATGKITGIKENDKYVVTLNVQQLETVFTEAREYQRGLPVTVESAKIAIMFAENTIAFSKQNNFGIDLTEPETTLNEAKGRLKNLVSNSGGTDENSATVDFKPVVELANMASNNAKIAVVEHLKVRAEHLAGETNTMTEFGQVIDSLPSDPDRARNTLVDFIKKARSLKMPDRKPIAPSPFNRHNGPLTGRISDGHVRFGGR